MSGRRGASVCRPGVGREGEGREAPGEEQFAEIYRYLQMRGEASCCLSRRAEAAAEIERPAPCERL